MGAGTPRAHEALRGIDLEIAPGGIHRPARPLRLRQIDPALPRRGAGGATSGELWSFGDRVETPSPERSLIFQEASLFPWLTVGQNVAFGLSIAGMKPAERDETAREALRRVGLIEAIGKRPDELSGGMRQRVAVARALAMKPRVLLMDEPFAALDVQTRAKMQDFLLDVWRGSGASVLFVTHHIDEAVALADRVVVFTSRPGRIKTVVPVDLPRPRDPFSPGAEALRRHLTEQLRDEVDRAFAEQETLSVP